MLKEKARELFNTSRKIKHFRDCNFIIGDFFEEASSKLLDFKRLSVNPLEETCPDLISRDSTVYLESKAGFKSWKLRRAQLTNYQFFKKYYFPDVDSPPIFKISLYFVLWLYDWRFTAPDFPENIQQSLSKSIISCYILDFDFILNFTKKLNKVEGIVFKPNMLRRNMGRIYKKSINPLEIYDLNSNSFDLYWNNKDMLLHE